MTLTTNQEKKTQLIIALRLLITCSRTQFLFARVKYSKVRNLFIKFTNRLRKSWTHEVFWACSLCQIHTQCLLLREVVLYPRVLTLYWHKYEKCNNHDINSSFNPSCSTRMFATQACLKEVEKSWILQRQIIETKEGNHLSGLEIIFPTKSYTRVLLYGALY